MLTRFLNYSSDSSQYKQGDLTPLWKKLIEEITSQKYRQLVSHIIKCDLSDSHLEINLWRYNNGCWLSAHTDKPNKVATQLFYFNSDWHATWGGALQILNSNSSTDVYQKIYPTLGCSVILVRSDQSWHAVDLQRSPQTVARLVL